jgi:hypothetical protein
MLITSDCVLLAKSKLRGGVKLAWSGGIGEIRKCGTGQYGSLYELQCTLNRGMISFMFDTYDAREDVAYWVSFAVAIWNQNR